MTTPAVKPDDEDRVHFNFVPDTLCYEMALDHIRDIIRDALLGGIIDIDEGAVDVILNRCVRQCGYLVKTL